MFGLLILSLFLSCITYYASAFSYTLVKYNCDLSLDMGEYMMGKEIGFDNDLLMGVYDASGVKLLNNTIVTPSQEYFVKIETPEIQGKKMDQIVFEVLGSDSVHFENGFCDTKNRIHIDNAKLVIPANVNDDVTLEIRCAWAKSYSHGVQLTNSLFLKTKSSDAVEL